MHGMFSADDGYSYMTSSTRLRLFIEQTGKLYSGTKVLVKHVHLSGPS